MHSQQLRTVASGCAQSSGMGNHGGITTDRRSKKKLVIATNLSLDPDWANCKICNCIDGNAGYERWAIDGFISTSTCPRRLCDAESFEWIDLYSHYHHGHLFNAGGIADQPAAYFEAMKLISIWVNKEHVQ